ncbi:hypothetical protein AB6A40_006033 [Gnathostoma spinigerum]|uniref:Nudix hydrolase domain-containing protein n=1 Tax=Gnathostoma spinigerum TaxID=75299 RepID=A0ABD6EPU9_9BILA
MSSSSIFSGFHHSFGAFDLILIHARHNYLKGPVRCLVRSVQMPVKNSCPYETTGPSVVLHEGKWLRLQSVGFRKPGGPQGQVWESVHRVTKASANGVDGVDIIPILFKDGKKFFVLVKQYRIPLSGFSLEFPAGLVDRNESVEGAGLRELKEETGYTANKVISVSKGKQMLDPGLSDDSVAIITVEIDGDELINQNPEQHLDEGESIEVVLVECSKIMEYLKSIEESTFIESMVYTFAVGYTMSHGHC